MLSKHIQDLSKFNNILICPLNWGLGHATRSTVIIDRLLEAGKNVTIASDGQAASFLHKRYPKLQHLTLPKYAIVYNSSNHFQLLLRNIGRFIKAIKSEHETLKSICSKNKFDCIISDSRLGCYHKNIHSILMTHQLQVVGINKFLRYAINQKLHAFLSKYNMIWVPDEKGHKLSGLLSKNLKLKNIDYIGPLSHLKQKSEELVYDYAIVLSGPEPARTVFQSSLISALSKKAHLKIALVQGTADTGIKTTPDHWDVHQLLDSEKLSKLIAQSRKIICRSGYSSIMDLYTLNKPAIMIPTPGQPEQIYLAQHLDNKYGFITIKQSNIKNGLDQLTT